MRNAARLCPMIVMCMGVCSSSAQSASAPAEAGDCASAEACNRVLQMGGLYQENWLEAYTAGPLSVLSKDCFARYCRDPDATPAADGVQIESMWCIELADGTGSLGELMGRDLRDFLSQRMGVTLPVEARSGNPRPDRIELDATGGGLADKPGSFTIHVEPGVVRVVGRDSAGLRDGVVRLVDLMGLRQAPIVKAGATTFVPRVALRVGRVPLNAAVRDAVFLGHNAIVIGYDDLFTLSTSDAIGGIRRRHKPGVVTAIARAVQQAHQYELKAYLHLKSSLLEHGDAAFGPDESIRGAELDFGRPGLHALCSEHPQVKRYYTESIAGLLRDTGLDGVMLIVGGEEFYHCFMRPAGCEKGGTNCPRCKPLGVESVVANLGNLLSEAARSVRPDAQVVLWPYGAYWAWAGDAAHAGMIERLKTGVALLVEPEVGEQVVKDEGITKHLWDYSIDMVGLGPRCRRQIEACRSAGVPIYLKSDHEHAYEACRLPGIPCMDRWFDRAEAMINSGADGLWVFAYVYRPCFGTTGEALGKHLYWSPAPGKEELLQQLARGVAGTQAGPIVRNAWGLVSQAIDLTPEIPPRYFMGPMCLGPEHPMCVVRESPMPACFYIGRGQKRAPLFDLTPSGNRPVFEKIYRQMEKLLEQAAGDMEKARAAVPPRCALVFDSEDLCIGWLYRTVRTTANFYESCRIRDILLSPEPNQSGPVTDKATARRLLARWREVLQDEERNTQEAISTRSWDIRLSQLTGYYPPNTSLLEAKLRLIRGELEQTLPDVGRRWAAR